MPNASAVDRLRRQRLAVAAQATRLIGGSQPHKVILDEFRRKIVNRDIACIDLPELEVTLVALQGGRAKPLGSLILQEARDRPSSL